MLVGWKHRLGSKLGARDIECSTVATGNEGELRSCWSGSKVGLAVILSTWGMNSIYTGSGLRGRSRIHLKEGNDDP